MNDVFICPCGVRTREVFRVKGQQLCALCAEMLDPAMVRQRAHQWLTAGRRQKDGRHRIWG